ncbi:MAG: hypothetical protein BGO72_10690 [Burkholderiales bacterium 70-64]|nr:MAG: hypothetical protein BGO72_10690 [Burkholderiales bacterium 70-64]
MLLQILMGTPKWVFGLFLALLWLGVSQRLDREVAPWRAAAMPAAMLGLSGWGVASAFGASLLGLSCWAAAGVLAFALVMRRALPARVRYDAASRRFVVPGSWVPLALIMGIFFTKYAVGVSLAFHPELARQAAFAAAVCTLYGVFSGVFAARAARLLRAAPGAGQARSPEADGRPEPAGSRATLSSS